MKQSSPASFNRVSSESELFARLRSPDVASQMKGKFREVGLRSVVKRWGFWVRRQAVAAAHALTRLVSARLSRT
jgi:hypothetical protein